MGNGNESFCDLIVPKLITSTNTIVVMVTANQIIIHKDIGTVSFFWTIHIICKKRGWVGGVSQMLTFAYMVGGWVMANAYISKIFAVD